MKSVARISACLRDANGGDTKNRDCGRRESPEGAAAASARKAIPFFFFFQDCGRIPGVSRPVCQIQEQWLLFRALFNRSATSSRHSNKYESSGGFTATDIFPLQVSRGLYGSGFHFLGRIRGGFADQMGDRSTAINKTFPLPDNPAPPLRGAWPTLRSVRRISEVRDRELDPQQILSVVGDLQQRVGKGLRRRAGGEAGFKGVNTPCSSL